MTPRTEILVSAVQSRPCPPVFQLLPRRGVLADSSIVRELCGNAEWWSSSLRLSHSTCQRDDGSCLLGSDGGLGLGERFSHVALVHDPITIDAGRLVAGDLHSDGLTDARALKVAHRRAP